MVTHFVDFAVEMYVVLHKDGPLRAKTYRSDTALIINVCFSQFVLYEIVP